MIIVFLLELCAFLFLMVLIMTQMVFPILNHTKMFPMFRREQKLNSDIVDLNQKVVEKELEQEIKTIKKEKRVK